jgi:hypothetical protein
VVTAKTQYNLKNVREYFKEHLCVGDYYNEGQRIFGEWTGLGAQRLGSGRMISFGFARTDIHVRIPRLAAGRKPLVATLTRRTGKSSDGNQTAIRGNSDGIQMPLG